MNHKKNIERTLYRIVEEISKENAPIVFKGALALKDLLYINNPDLEVNRKTIDIDANWVSEYDRDKIIKLIDKAVKNVDPDYNVVVYREPAERKSMGLKVLDKDGSVFTKIDMDIKDNPFYIECLVNDVNIKYSDFNKMLGDKLYSLSNEHVFRRVKDLLDCYLIIRDNKISKEEIEKVLEYDGRSIGDFTTMINGKKDLKIAYESLEGIDNKPDFEEVWETLIEYLIDEKLLDKRVYDLSNDLEI